MLRDPLHEQKSLTGDPAEHIPRDGARIPLLESTYAVLGVPVHVRTHSPELLQLADDALGDFLSASTEPRSLSLTLTLGRESDPSDGIAPCFRADLNTLTVDFGGSHGYADRIQGTAEAEIAHSALESPDVAAGMVEPLVMFLAAGVRRATLHAAALSLGDQGLLLTGSAGAGKSTLAYACMRAGFSLVAEDIVVAEEPYAHREVWGDSRYVHLLPDAVAFFPELAGTPLTPRGAEKRLRISAQDRKPCMRVNAILQVARSSEWASRIVPVLSSELRSALTQFEGDPPIDRKAMDLAVDSLLGVRSGRIEVGFDLASAAAEIRRWLEIE
jgi:hypothetical protein